MHSQGNFFTIVAFVIIEIMENTGLVEVLKCLTVNEIKALDDFIGSAYHNRSARVLQLYQAIRKAYPDFKQDTIRKEDVFKKIFGRKPFNAVLLRNLVSDTMARVEEFLAIHQLSKDVLLQKRLVRQSFIERKLYTRAAQSLQESVSYHKKIKKVDTDYFLNDFLQLHSWFSISFNQQYRGNLHKLYKKQGIESLIESLDGYYLLEYSLLVGEMVNSYRAHNKPFDADVHVRRIELFLMNQEDIHPVVCHRLKHCLMLLKSDIGEYPVIRQEFERLSVQMDDSIKIASIVELYGIATYQAWQGNKYFIEQLDELIELRERFNLILDEGGMINPIAFNNIVRIKLRKGLLKESLQFIKKYENHLSDNIKDDTLKLSLASVEMHQSEHRKAVDILLTIQKPFFASEIIYRRMLIKCYFELKDWTTLESTLESTKKYIQNNTHIISRPILLSMKKYLDMVTNLYKYVLHGRPTHKKQIEQLLKEGGFTFDEDWIREKLQ